VKDVRLFFIQSYASHTNMSTSDSDSSDEQMEIVQADPQNQQLSDSDNNAGIDLIY
jgi:hypothetical protein